MRTPSGRTGIFAGAVLLELRGEPRAGEQRDRARRSSGQVTVECLSVPSGGEAHLIVDVFG